MLAPGIEENGRDVYGKPKEHVREYVRRAIEELGVDNNLVNDTDSTMYAWRLSYESGNVLVAQEVLNMRGATLSQLARAMADTDEKTKTKIQKDGRYHNPPMREDS